MTLNLTSKLSFVVGDELSWGDTVIRLQYGPTHSLESVVTDLNGLMFNLFLTIFITVVG